MALHNILGKEGEKVAFRFIEQLKLRILATNWTHNGKELDLVATDGNWLVVFEVKTRIQDSVTKPIEAVNRKKQEHISLAADAYVRINRLNLPVRFDVLSVIYLPAQGIYEVEHVPNAFYAPQSRAKKNRY